MALNVDTKGECSIKELVEVFVVKLRSKHRVAVHYVRNQSGICVRKNV